MYTMCMYIKNGVVGDPQTRRRAIHRSDRVGPISRGFHANSISLFPYSIIPAYSFSTSITNRYVELTTKKQCRTERKTINPSRAFEKININTRQASLELFKKKGYKHIINYLAHLLVCCVCMAANTKQLTNTKYIITSGR